MTADETTETKEQTPAETLANVMGEGGKVLNQDEIDSLLGFDSKAREEGGTGIQAMLDKALSSYERLPMR